MGQESAQPISKPATSLAEGGNARCGREEDEVPEDTRWTPYVGRMEPLAFPGKPLERGRLEPNLAVHPTEGRAENFGGLWFWEQPGPKEAHGKVCPKTAVLVTTRFSCCHGGAPQEFASLSGSVYRQTVQGWPGRAAPGSSSPQSPVIPEEPPWGQGGSLRSQQQDRERSTKGLVLC